MITSSSTAIVRIDVLTLLQSRNNAASTDLRNPFLDEIVQFLISSKRSHHDVVATAADLLVYGVETRQDLEGIAHPNDRVGFRNSPVPYRIPPAICNFLHGEYVSGDNEGSFIPAAVAVSSDEVQDDIESKSLLSKKNKTSSAEGEEKPKEGTSWSTIAVYTGVAATCAVAAPLAVTGGLDALGFGTDGIAVGSVAASWMAMYGGAVSSGSAIALCQSAGAAGLSAATTAGLGATGAAAGVAATKKLRVGKTNNECADDKKKKNEKTSENGHPTQ